MAELDKLFFTSQVSKADLCDEGLRPFKTPKAPLRGVPLF